MVTGSLLSTHCLSGPAARATAHNSDESNGEIVLGKWQTGAAQQKIPGRRSYSADRLWDMPGTCFMAWKKKVIPSLPEIAVEADNKDGASDSQDSNHPAQGIAVLKNDIAEIELLIRKGTPVTIILNRNERPR